MSSIEPMADGPLKKTSDNSPLEAKKDSEWFCAECGARITKTKSFGEVGHGPECSRRETHYSGMTGKTGFQNGRLNKEEGSA